MHKYLRSKLYIDYREVEKLTEVSEYFDLDVKENIQAAVNDIGLKKVMEAIGTEKALEAIGTEKALEMLDLMDEKGFSDYLKKRNALH